MAFPLAAIGAGLGIGANDIMRQRQQALQTAVTQLAIQQQVRQQQAQALAGQLLPQLSANLGSPQALAGLPGNMPPMQPGTGGTGISRAPSASAPQASPRAIPQGPMTGGTPTGVIPLDSGAASEAAADERARQLGVPLLDSEPPPMQPSSSAASTAAGQPPAPSQGSSQPTSGAGESTNAQISNPLIQRLLGPQINLKDISDAIQKARPGVDPAVAFNATQMIYNLLERGSAQQQNAALRVLTQLEIDKRFGASLGERAREADVRYSQGAQRVGIAQQNAATAARKAVTAASQGAQRIEGQQAAAAERKREFDQRHQDNESKLAEARDARSMAAKQSILRSQLASIDRQMSSLRMQPTPDQNQIATLAKDRAAVIKAMNEPFGAPVTSAPIPAQQ